MTPPTSPLLQLPTVLWLGDVSSWTVFPISEPNHPKSQSYQLQCLILFLITPLLIWLNPIFSSLILHFRHPSLPLKPPKSSRRNTKRKKALEPNLSKLWPTASLTLNASLNMISSSNSSSSLSNSYPSSLNMYYASMMLASYTMN